MSATMAVAMGPGGPAHSNLGASGMSRWARCPGSYALSRDIEPPRPSIHAATGTVAHDLIEGSLMRSRPGELAPDLLGTTRDVDGHTITIDNDLLAGVAVMEDYVRRVAPSYEVMWVERRVSLDGYFPRRFPPPEPLFGRADVILISTDQRLIEIVDYKHGRGVAVGVEDNHQLLYYAAGALMELSPAVSAQIDWVRMTIVQPRIDPAHPVKSWDTSALDVELWVSDVLIPAVRAASEPDAPLVPGDWCRFCPAVRVCPELEKAAVEAAQKSFEPITPGPTPATGLADALERAERAELWIEAIRDYAYERLGRGDVVPGWGLVPKRALRAWDDPEVVRDILAQHVNDLDPLIRTELRSPAQVEKELRDRPDLWRLVTDHIQSVSSGLKLSRVKSEFAPIPVNQGD